MHNRPDQSEGAGCTSGSWSQFYFRSRVMQAVLLRTPAFSHNGQSGPTIYDPSLAQHARVKTYHNTVYKIRVVT